MKGSARGPAGHCASDLQRSGTHKHAFVESIAKAQINRNMAGQKTWRERTKEKAGRKDKEVIVKGLAEHTAKNKNGSVGISDKAKSV